MISALDYLEFHARLQPERLLAMELSSGRQWSYREFDTCVLQCATVLLQRNIGVGDRVAALGKNCAELIMLHLACARIGAIYVPLNWRLTPIELANLIEDAEPAIIFGDACLEVAGLKEGVSFDSLALDIAKAQSYSYTQTDNDLPSLILFTSGTSGRPKGALLSEANLNETALNFSLLGKVTGRSVFLCDAPMFHVVGLVTNIRPVLMQGGAFIISDGFDPGKTLQRFTDSKLAITHYFCVPQMAQALRAHPEYDPAKLAGLTALFTGGAPHPAAYIQAWLADGIVIVDGYGMSEAGTVFGMPVNAELIAKRAGSVGIASPRVQAKIVDASGETCRVGLTGELLIKGANVISGYWRRPQASLEAFTDEGWFHTGDIARADEQGYFWLVDRLKDMFISGGENVYPNEIEAVLAQHPQVVESAVIGVSDERWGEVGHLFMVTSQTIATNDILEYLEQHLAKYKVPKQVSVIDALPRNGAGKVVKNVLCSMV